MKRQIDNDDGVSPVIGTILLVALTVVLAALVSASALGMASGIRTSHIIGVSVDPGEEGELLVTVFCGDADDLKTITVYNGSRFVDVVPFSSVGTPLSFKNPASLASGKADISVVGRFKDGNQTLYSGTVVIK
ncbi:type IV pilin [Methanocorpusculum sp. GPch4]|uniref:type IV pilin n=1 Tax=Methanocorpusculum sp. GPch4 TaxID=2527877 RepID=UPI001432B82A|nr:type IV pilin N-terminal domain-containing protein [Methanocorpusculum sp. GPch4]